MSSHHHSRNEYSDDDDSMSVLSEILKVEGQVLASPSKDSRKVLQHLNLLRQSILEGEGDNVMLQSSSRSVVSTHNNRTAISAAEDSSIHSSVSWPLQASPMMSSPAPHQQQQHYYGHYHPQPQPMMLPPPPPSVYHSQQPPIFPPPLGQFAQRLPQPQQQQQPVVGDILFVENNSVRDDISSLRSTYTPTSKSKGASTNLEAVHEEDSEYAPDLDMTEPKQEQRISTALWNVFSFLVTFFFPDACIPRDTVAAKQAWREKVAIFVIFLLCSAGFALAIALPIMFCFDTSNAEYFDTFNIENNLYTKVHGQVYDLKELFRDLHPGGAKVLEEYLGRDASSLFPRLPPAELPSVCLNPLLEEHVFNDTNSMGLQNVTCPNLSSDEIYLYGAGTACHDTVVGIEKQAAFLHEYHQGLWVLSEDALTTEGLEDTGLQYIVVDDSIYDVTEYIQSLKLETGFIDPDPENVYLSPALHNLIVNKVNEDTTALFNELFFGPERAFHKACLDELFYHASIDRSYSKVCSSIGVVQYIMVGIFSGLVLIQVICSLAYIARRPPYVNENEMQKGVMIMVPCYNESFKELRKTIDSILKNDYPDEQKVMVVVADGVITGRGEKYSTPEILGKILGFDFDPMDAAFPYQSQGSKDKETNYVSLYPGVYTNPEAPQKKLKYIVMVKQGGEQERMTPRAGNRGKRDSQLLLFGILNRMQHNRKPTELDHAFMNSLLDLQLPLNTVEYLMAVDADTRLKETALKYLMHRLEKSPSVIACCGETRVDNKTVSFVSMLQVFEYYSSHHIKKAFESVFGCVTCLPGCFTMYRLYSSEREPVLTSDTIFKAYSRKNITSLHERNLFELGEDRMLTTLLLQTFYGSQLSFVPEATCWTIVPDTFQVLVSQRRRWLNSTVHNMLELAKVQTLCGISFFSMRLIVLADLLSTFLLPAGLVYLYYLVIDMAITQVYSTFSLFVVFGCLAILMVPFIFRAQWQFFLWFIIYLVGGIPIFYVYLPVYAFWHMDDLSWGQTRQVNDLANKAEQLEVLEGSSATLVSYSASSDCGTGTGTAGSKASSKSKAKKSATSSTAGQSSKSLSSRAKNNKSLHSASTKQVSNKAFDGSKSEVSLSSTSQKPKSGKSLSPSRSKPKASQSLPSAPSRPKSTKLLEASSRPKKNSKKKPKKAKSMPALPAVEFPPATADASVATKKKTKTKSGNKLDAGNPSEIQQKLDAHRNAKSERRSIKMKRSNSTLAIHQELIAALPPKAKSDRSLSQRI